jgi:hypothetical protein
MPNSLSSVFDNLSTTGVFMFDLYALERKFISYMFYNWLTCTLFQFLEQLTWFQPNLCSQGLLFVSILQHMLHICFLMYILVFTQCYNTVWIHATTNAGHNMNLELDSPNNMDMVATTIPNNTILDVGTPRPEWNATTHPEIELQQTCQQNQNNNTLPVFVYLVSPPISAVTHSIFDIIHPFKSLNKFNVNVTSAIICYAGCLACLCSILNGTKVIWIDILIVIVLALVPSLILLYQYIF